MTDATLDGELPLSIEPSYLGAGHSLASWLTSTDHKRIAILYAISITFFFFLGGIAIAIVRMELFTPGADVVSADTYNKLFTFPGIIMVFPGAINSDDAGQLPASPDDRGARCRLSKTQPV